MKQNLQAQSGNRVAVVFDGKQIGAMQSARMTDDYGLEPVYGIGDINPIENVPTAARYSLSCQNVVLRKGAMRAAGLIPENGNEVLQGLVFDVEVYDKDDGSLIRKHVGCSYTSGDIDFQRNAIIMASAQFVCLNASGSDKA